MQSLSRIPVAMLYIVGNIALGIHLFHGSVVAVPVDRLEQPPVQRVASYIAAGSPR